MVKRKNQIDEYAWFKQLRIDKSDYRSVGAEVKQTYEKFLTNFYRLGLRESPKVSPQMSWRVWGLVTSGVKIISYFAGWSIVMEFSIGGRTAKVVANSQSCSVYYGVYYGGPGLLTVTAKTFCPSAQSVALFVTNTHQWLLLNGPADRDVLKLKLKKSKKKKAKKGAK